MRGNSRKDKEMDFSNQSLTLVPDTERQDTVVSLNLSVNLLRDLKNIEFFSNLRYLNISQNKVSDLSPVAACAELIELDCSQNSIKKLDTLSNLPSLRVLNASYNAISNITQKLPLTLVEVDLSNNLFDSFEFLQDKLGDELITLDISGNKIEEIRTLRFVAVFTKLLNLNVGLLEANRDLKILQFAKHLCPNLETFDGVDCAHIDSQDFFNPDALIEILVNGTESELRVMLSSAAGPITWDEPQFVPFEADIPVTPLKKIDERLKKLEQKLPEDGMYTPRKKREQQVDPAEIREIREEIQELREQVLQISELLYVHDCAMKKLWEKQ